MEALMSDLEHDVEVTRTKSERRRLAILIMVMYPGAFEERNPEAYFADIQGQRRGRSCRKDATRQPLAVNNRNLMRNRIIAVVSFVVRCR
jgi:hypothetical protein